MPCCFKLVPCLQNSRGGWEGSSEMTCVTCPDGLCFCLEVWCHTQSCWNSAASPRSGSVWDDSLPCWVLTHPGQTVRYSTSGTHILASCSPFFTLLFSLLLRIDWCLVTVLIWHRHWHCPQRTEQMLSKSLIRQFSASSTGTILMSQYQAADAQLVRKVNVVNLNSHSIVGHSISNYGTFIFLLMFYFNLAEFHFNHIE